MMLAALWGCADAQLKPFEEARQHWEAGRRSGKAEDFAAARAADPQSISLVLWHGQALAAAGDLPGAILAMDTALARQPNLGLAHYNRAAYLARAGDLPASAAALERGIALGASSPWLAAVDADFVAVRKHPEFAGLLPTEDILARIEPVTPGFVGGEMELVVVVHSGEGALLEFVDGVVPECISPYRVVQNDSVKAGTLQREFRYSVRAEAPCEVEVQITAVSGATRVPLRAWVRVLGPEGMPTLGETKPGMWVVPSAVTGAAGMRWEWRVEEQTRARG